MDSHHSGHFLFTPSLSDQPLSLPLLGGRNYRCQCGQAVFFRNSQCLACRTPLGYDCERGQLVPLVPGPYPGAWLAWAAWTDSSAAPTGPVYKRCQNLLTPAACNWLLDVNDRHALCRACRLNRTIPDLFNPYQPDNGHLWGLVEQAKHRLISSLILLGLPVASRLTEDPFQGLMFDFLRSPLYGPHIMTGHHTGLITLNIDEADDAHREAVRKSLREPYRTLLGHLRHEVGHYYWDRLIANTAWLPEFRALFGDESQDYVFSLQRHYEQGTGHGWQANFISVYASIHPWEDWAECWAHYLHMRDAIDTALSFGLRMEQFDLEFTPLTLDTLYQPTHPEAEQFLSFINHWIRLTTMLNEMSRSMGQADFYPFVLSPQAVRKLHFIHGVVSAGSA